MKVGLYRAHVIYDIRGSVVRDITLGIKSAGYYTDRNRAIHWDGRNSTGERVSTGVYFYQFKTDDMSVLRKMVILTFLTIVRLM